MQMHKDYSTYSHIRFKLLLAICWVVGLLLGLYLAIHLPEKSSSLVRALLHSRVSTVGFVANLFLPIILSAIVWKLKIPAFYLLIAFCKAIGYSFCFSAITLLFHEAGWLLRWLLLFSDTFISAILLWFWFSHVNVNTGVRKDLCICCVLAIFICLADICFVTPLFQGLFLV